MKQYLEALAALRALAAAPFSQSAVAEANAVLAQADARRHLNEHMLSVLDCSNAHLTPWTAETIKDYVSIVRDHEYGAMLYIPSPDAVSDAEWAEESADYPEDLRLVMTAARLAGIDWINFDADGPTIDGWPTYEWE